MNQARRIAIQRLTSLQRCGLHAIPAPQGGHNFQLSPDSFESNQSRENSDHAQADEPAVLEKSKAAEPTSKPAAGTKIDTNKIREAKPEYLLTPELTDYEHAPLSADQRQNSLDILNQQVAGCTNCRELAACRNNTVFGVGNIQPELCFLGEGPGADEDRQGEPFVGKAGQLLDKIIGACKMSRDEVYILNTVKCRPPGNRNPSEDELSNCWPYAIQQLEILQPKFICCLGSVAAKTLLKTKQSIGRMRGQFFQFRGSQVIVTYHPAYLLRNPSAKRQVWDDMKMLLTKMGREI